MNIKGLDGRWLDPLRWLEYLTLRTKSLDVSAQDGNSISKWFRAGGRGRNVKIWRKWVIDFFFGRMCLLMMGGGSDSHMLPLKPGGHTVGSCSSVVGLQCATREMLYWTTPSLSDWVFLQWLPRQPSCHASSFSAEMLLPFFKNFFLIMASSGWMSGITERLASGIISLWWCLSRSRSQQSNSAI